MISCNVAKRVRVKIPEYRYPKNVTETLVLYF